MNQLPSSPLFDISLTLHPPHDIGETPLGKRRIVPVSGGMFIGERLRGIVLPNAGADWVLVRNDGSVQLDVRLTLQTDDEALIYMQYLGKLLLDENVAAAVAQGRETALGETYFMTQPRFETGHPKYAWLNRIVAVAEGRLIESGVEYQVFECVHG